MPSSLEIAQAAKLRPIEELALELGLKHEEIDPYGRHMAKMSLSAIDRLASRPDGKLIVVTGITPTPLGEGKTTTAIGLAQGLCRLGVKAGVTVRQPSLGPIFGIKGGATGGGRAQIIPMEQVNLNLTGDNHAVAAAHNLASAFLDNHIHHGNALGIDPRTIGWPRTVDISDRALRKAVVGLGGRENGPPRETDWVIASASEVMAILALSGSIHDLRKRLGRIVVAEKSGGGSITLDDLKVAGAMTVLMREAIKPNLLQTLEGGPAFMHAGPFGNIAHGTNSVVADRLALKLCDYVCTEAGFGADLGAEKLFNIKCRQSGLRPSAAIIVATIRALKMHGGVGKIVAGKPLDPQLLVEDPDAVRIGAENLAKHVENVGAFGVPCIVALNAFPTDTPAEIEAARQVAIKAGARDLVVSNHFSDGGAGSVDLARAVKALADEGAPNFRLLYPEEMALAKKIETVASVIYGADGVDFAKGTLERLAALEKAGHGALPICMAKTHLSLSAEPSKKGRPRGFRIPVREVRLLAGAGFITVVTGDMSLMPGLPSKPVGEGMDIDINGRVLGLS
jgi:formate--tetrahydrofolate ligase